MEALTKAEKLNMRQKIIDILNESDAHWSEAPEICASALNAINALRGESAIYRVQSGWQYDFLGLHKKA